MYSRWGKHTNSRPVPFLQSQHYGYIGNCPHSTHGTYPLSESMRCKVLPWAQTTAHVIECAGLLFKPIRGIDGLYKTQISREGNAAATTIPLTEGDRS
jgi:hypothetical protein